MSRRPEEYLLRGRPMSKSDKKEDQKNSRSTIRTHQKQPAVTNTRYLRSRAEGEM